jgi:hypothetical protein
MIMVGVRCRARLAIVFGVLLLIGLGWLCANPLRAAAANCPNEAVRTGLSAQLPDCRAYEMVAPGDLSTFPLPIANFEAPGSVEVFPTELMSPSRSSFLYLTHESPPLGASEPNGTSDLFEAQRTAQGWITNRRLSPSGTQAVTPNIGGASVDHLYAFTSVAPKGSGRPGGSLGDGGRATYLSQPDGSFEFVGLGSVGGVQVIEREAQGRYISEGGKHVIFTTGNSGMQSVYCGPPSPPCPVRKLAANAPESGTGAVYVRGADGPTRVVSLLPGDAVPAPGEQAFYKGTSKDASSVAFTIADTLYVRVHNGAGAEEKTVQVAEGEPSYAGITADGNFLFYVAGGDRGTIHRFNTETEADVEVNPTAEGEIVNVSSDGSHVYFISEEPIGGQGEVGHPNLYVWSGSAPEYIASVVPSDLVKTSGSLEGVPALTRWTDYAVAPLGYPTGVDLGPGGDSSRSTPNGGVLVFESRAKLTSYGNADHTEIYRYDDTNKSLVCVSCSPLAGSSTADARLQELKVVPAAIVLHNLTANGERVFFETAQALVSRDTDDVNDIYEWRAEEGGGAKLELISAGLSTQYLPPPEWADLAEVLPNLLYAISNEGEDVAFMSQDALVPGASVGGMPSLYDARVEGGFAAPASSQACQEEGCRPVAGGSLPVIGVQASEELHGHGNVKPRKRKAKRCHRRRAGSHARSRRPCRKHRGRPYANSAVVASSVSGLEDTQTQAAEGRYVDGAWQSSGSAASTPSTMLAPVTSGGSEFEAFGIKSVGVEESTVAAGAHPDFTTAIELNSRRNVNGNYETDARTQEVSVSLPPGLLGDPNAVPRCPSGALLAFANCPPDSQVGVVRVIPSDIGVPKGGLLEPLYNLQPPHPDREIARFGFQAVLYPVFIDVKVRSAGDFGVTATVHSSPAQAGLIKAATTFWGNPSAPVHNTERLTAGEAWACGGTACKVENGERASTIPAAARRAFMTNPAACQGGEVAFSVKSYQLPGQIFSASAPMPTTTDCTGLPFAPAIEAEPTSHAAGASTGLETKLLLPQHLGEGERATATMREARVTLPAGMQVAASAANWIGTCSDQQVGFHEEVDTSCPDASKLGTATIVSPALATPIEGTIYQRSPQPRHQLGLWLTSDALGMHIKLSGELEPDEQTGRLTAVFRDLPQVPVEEIDLNIWGGSRAPLQNPDHCGTFTTNFSFSPHSNDPAAIGQSQMQITEGCNQSFSPALHAGVTKPRAGRFSPFVLDLNREDGQQALRGFELTLPDGELAKLKGVPLCSDADAAAGACPGSSRIGSLTATTGPGPEPFTLPGPDKAQPQIYLAGAYREAPFSIVSEVPAQAGPFDLGVLAVRSGLDVEPETGRAVVKADPLPQFFGGIGIAYRHLHAVIDRPNFSLNPTDCREMAVTSVVTSTQGTVAHPQARFQVDGCKRLNFRPKLSLKLRGGTRRADYPALTAVLTARKGDANIAFASVALPHSEFLAQEHIGTICTRKQFAADKCPKGSVYGKAKAWTPLLDKPLSGPVFMRSSNHPLPDLVAKLGGQLEIDLVGRIDSQRGGIRTTFESVPDAPVSKFVLQMKGGAKGLLTNSTDICRDARHAAVAMRAQNGRTVNFSPKLVAGGCNR